MKVRYIMVAVLVTILLVVGIYAVRQNQNAGTDNTNSPPATSVNVNQIALDTGVSQVFAEGQIVPLKDVALTFQGGGTVAEVLVEKGQFVEANTPLVRLSATELEATLAQANAGIAQAEASVTQAEASVTQAEASVTQAEASVTQAQTGLEVAQAQVEAAQAQLDAAHLSVVAAQAQLDLIVSSPLTEEISFLQANINAANAAISQADANRDILLQGATQAQLQAAEAAVATAEVQVNQLEQQYDQILDAGIGGPVEEQTRFGLAAARATLASTNSTLNDLRNGPNVSERTAANASVSVVIAQRDAAQAQLDLLLAGAKPEQVAIAQVAIEQAQASVIQAEAGMIQANAGRGQAESALAQAEAGLAIAQAALQQAQAAVPSAEAGVVQARAGRDAAQATLDRMVLHAPFAGTVADIMVELGDVVGMGMPVVVLADFSQWLVKTTDLTELDVVNIAVDFPVTISIDAIPDETIDGTITDIATVSRLIQGDVTYEVTIALHDDKITNLPLRWGMTAFVEVDK